MIQTGQEELATVARLGLLSQALLFDAWQELPGGPVENTQ